MTTVLEHKYSPAGAATQLFRCRASEVVLSGPAGTGKSRACLEKLHMMALLNPGMRGLIVRKTMTSLTSTALVTFREHVAHESLLAGDCIWYGGSAAESPQYRYKNGSQITVGGMDKATRIMSSEYDVIYVQEAIELTENDWEALTTRLRHGKVSFQQLMADTNPDTATHWLKQRIDAGRTVMLESRHTDNPVLYPDGLHPSPEGQAYLDKLDQLTGVRRLRLRDGKWVAAEGIIYEEFDTVLHIIDAMPSGWTDWVRYWSIDFGYTNPFVLQRWAQDPDGRLYLYAETYMTRRLVEDHCAEVKEQVKNEPRPRSVVCDHDAEDRATLERYLGVSTIAAKKTVSDGIQAVASRLRVQEDGKPRLFILRNALTRRDTALVDAKKPTCTLEEIPGYIWENGTKDRPLKQDDHGCDAMRYVVAECDLSSRPRVRIV